MNHSTSTIDLTNQQEAARVLPQTPLVASYHTGWKGLTFTHYCHPPHKTVEHCLLQHSLTIADPKSCFKAERRLDGKFKTLRPWQRSRRCYPSISKSLDKLGSGSRIFGDCDLSNIAESNHSGSNAL